MKWGDGKVYNSKTTQIQPPGCKYHPHGFEVAKSNERSKGDEESQPSNNQKYNRNIPATRSMIEILDKEIQRMGLSESMKFKGDGNFQDK